MHLPNVTNAPRVIALDGTSYRARALTLGQLGEVLAWLDDQLPDRPDREGPPRLSDEASRIALATTEGLAVILHLALLSCQPELTRDQARSLAPLLTVEDEARLLSIAFRVPSIERGGNPEDPPPSSKDLAEVSWGALFERLVEQGILGYEQVAQLTLDQLENRLSRGAPADAKAEPGVPLSLAEVQALWEKASFPNVPHSGDPTLG